MRNSVKNKKGFTLVESLVAISIVVVAVTTVFAAAQSGISATSMVRNRITAVYLAQEGQEAVKNIKDSNLHLITAGHPITWLDGISICDPGPCGYDVRSNPTPPRESEGKLQQCGAGDGCEIKIDNEGFFRQFAGTASTGFIREIYVDETIAGAEAEVRVVIKRPGSGFQDFEVKNVIYSWFEYRQ